MKKLTMLFSVLCLTLALTVPASALDYNIDGPGDPEYGKSTSIEPVVTADRGKMPNVDVSKNAALIPPTFGSASGYTLNTGNPLTPTHDWAVFNSDRRYYRRLQDAGTYLEEFAEETAQPEVKSVEDFLDNIENQQLYQILIMVDRLTLQIVVMKIQGYSTREIASRLNTTEKAVYRRIDRLKEKLKKFFE